jgi:predicted TIM-barrel fold metal-dependent hydrolase
MSPSLGHVDAGLRVDLVRAYNDFQSEFASVAPDRYFPITSLPFWDMDASIAELHRCTAMGHKGITFTQDPGYFGLPLLTDRHWDRLWSACQEARVPVNFHIATGDVESVRSGRHPANGLHANHASTGVQFFLGNARTIAQLVCGGICHRFPELDFVSVESGIGWVPFALDSLDWQWKNSGVAIEHPEYDLLPSEYFARQIYACFWFEDEALDYVVSRIGANNLMFETDFPHPTSLTPGPCSAAPHPTEHIEKVFRHTDLATATKVLHDNAARVYGLRAD